MDRQDQTPTFLQKTGGKTYRDSWPRRKIFQTEGRRQKKVIIIRKLGAKKEESEY
jgi:hypothetical protein